MKVTVRVRTETMTAGFQALRSRWPMAVSRSLTRAGTAAKTFMTKQCTADLGLPAKYVQRTFGVEKGSDFLRLFVTGYRIPLIGFNARAVKGRGVAYTMQGQRKRIPNAFIATMPNAGPERNWHEGVYVRIGKSRTRLREPRGPSMPFVFEKYLPAGEQVAEIALKKNLSHEISYALKK